MTTVDWLVLLAGIAAIVWVNWYFFIVEAENVGRGKAEER